MAIVVLAITKVLNWKLITTLPSMEAPVVGCTSYYEGTELKANHNYGKWTFIWLCVVLAITKVLNWKLITTTLVLVNFLVRCTSYYEGTELKANHNRLNDEALALLVVLAITKVLNWKLITTRCSSTLYPVGCTSYYEGTELKANHNKLKLQQPLLPVVLAITKVLNWKLITTKIHQTE